MLVVLEGRGSRTALDEAPAPSGQVLLCFANPFAPPEAIRFALDAPGRVELRIVDVAGRVVRNLADGMRPAGNHSVAWDGRDARGAPVGQGVYVLDVTVDGRQKARQKLIVIR